MMKTFNDIKSIVESQYPMPIAQAFRRYRISDSNDLGGRHKLLIDLFELLIKLLCIIQLQEGLKKSKNYIEKLPNKEKTLEFLKRPSLGGWLGFLRSLSLIAQDNPGLKYGKSIHDWYFSEADTESIEIFKQLDNIDGLNFNKKNKKHRQEITNALVNYRNKNIGHGVHCDNEVLEDRLKTIESIMAYLIISAGFLTDINMVVIDGVVLSEGNKWQINCKELRGLTSEPIQIVNDKPLNLNELYLIEKLVAGESVFENISLEPFTIWKLNEQQKQYEVFIFSSSWKTKLEYISYSSGTYYYHKELHEEFRNLLSIELAEGLEDNLHEDLSEEKKIITAHNFFKKGLSLSRDGKVEDAIAYLEQSILYDRKPETFIELAKLHYKLGDSPETIKNILQNCLDIDPDNIMALELFDKANESNIEANKSTIKEADEKKVFVTIYDALFPPRLRPYVFPFLAIIIISVAGIFAFYEYNIVPEINSFLLYLAGLFFITPIFIYINTPKKMERIRLPLSLQVSTMRLDRFNAWFDSQIRYICGDFVLNNDGKINIIESIKAEKKFLLFMLPFMIIVAPLIFFSIESHLLPHNIQILRGITSLGGSLIIYIGMRYVFTVTVFVLRFSSLPLKPLVTSLNNDGFRSLGSFLITNISTMMLLIIAVWAALGFVLKSNLGIDLVALVITVLVGATWSMGLPMSLYHAGKEAKNQISHKYSMHLEAALEKFIDDPGENTLQNYEWLLKQQKVIKRIPCWPLSLFQTITYIVGLNLLLIATALTYVYIRY